MKIHLIQIFLGEIYLLRNVVLFFDGVDKEVDLKLVRKSISTSREKMIN